MATEDFQLLEAQHIILIRKGATALDPQTPKGIENVLDTSRKLEEAIKELEKQRGDARAELTQSLAQYLAAAPLSVDGAIVRYNALNAKDEALKAKFTAVKELQSIIETLIEELKKKQPKAFEDALRRKYALIKNEEAFLRKLKE
jgi:thymidylate synthase ThyX